VQREMGRKVEGGKRSGGEGNVREGGALTQI